MIAPELHRPMVLVVDDDALSARILARMLRDDGFDTEIACDGAAAISRLARSPRLDALITDYRMPHADGLTVAKFARSQRPGIQLFVVTGYTELLHDVDKTLDPAPVILSKPLHYAALTHALR